MSVVTNPVRSTLLTKPQVCELLSLSPRGLENLVRANEFPPPVRIGRYVYWSPLAVQEWQRALFAAQEHWASNSL